MSKWKRTDTKAREPQGTRAKVQTKAQVKARNEPLEHVCVVARKDTRKLSAKSRLRHVQKCGKVGHLRAVCRNTNTHEIEKDADEPSPEVIVKAVWSMVVRDTVDDGHCDCIEMHDVRSEHRDESKFTDFPEHRDESKFRKVIKSIETGQISRKVTANTKTGQHSRKVITNIETGPTSEKWSRRSREDINRDMNEFVQNEWTDQKIAASITQRNRDELADGPNSRTWKNGRIRDELADGPKIGAAEHEIIHGEVSGGSKVETR